jgi:hypothetical protein
MYKICSLLSEKYPSVSPCFATLSRAMKSAHKIEGPREETRKKMKPVKRDEFTALMQKAIHTPSKKSAGKTTRPELRESEKD